MRSSSGPARPAPVSATLISIPPGFGSPVSMRSTRGPSATSAMASQALTSRLSTTCWSWTPSPSTRGRSCSTRSEEHTSELQSRLHLVCRLLLEKKKTDHKHRQLGAKACVDGFDQDVCKVAERGGEGGRIAL